MAKTIVVKKKLPPPKKTEAYHTAPAPQKSSDAELTEALGKVRKSIEAQGLDKPETKEIPMNTTATPASGTAKKKVVVKKTAAKPAKAEKTTRADGYTAGDMAKEVGVTPAELRKALRGSKAKKPGASWTWASKSAAAETLSKVKAFLKDSGSKKK